MRNPVINAEQQIQIKLKYMKKGTLVLKRTDPLLPDCVAKRKPVRASGRPATQQGSPH